MPGTVLSNLHALTHFNLQENPVSFITIFFFYYYYPYCTEEEKVALSS